MQLSRSSWHYTLHQLLYGKYADNPRNFCPYFWKTIVVGLIFIVPLTIISIPMILIGIVLKKNGAPNVKDEGFLSEFLVAAIFADAAVILLFCMIRMLWIPFDVEKLSPYQILGILGYGIALFGTFFVIRSSVKSMKMKKKLAMIEAGLISWESSPNPRRKQKGPNVFIEYLKAWYKKNCPLIDWKE